MKDESESGHRHLLDGKIEVRFDDDGGFDELVNVKGAVISHIHLEMMDDKTLWIGIGPAGSEYEVHVTVSSRGKLSISAHEA